MLPAGKGRTAVGRAARLHPAVVGLLPTLKYSATRVLQVWIAAGRDLGGSMEVPRVWRVPSPR